MDSDSQYGSMRLSWTEGNILLSILICTVVGREDKFKKLYTHLYDQCLQVFADSRIKVEIISEKDNKEISVGAKRQKLLNRAKGEYVVFVDDDDWVSDTYVSKIAKALVHGTDCVGFLIDCEFDERGKKRSASAISSLKYKQWGEDVDGFKYVRSIYHKTPVKREIALQVGFQDMRFGEDHPYSMGVTALCETETFIPEVLYYYRYKQENHNEKYGIRD